MRPDGGLLIGVMNMIVAEGLKHHDFLPLFLLFVKITSRMRLCRLKKKVQNIWIFDVFMILPKTKLLFNSLRAVVRLYTFFFLKGQILQEC